jgi:hypothetical protein
MANIARLKTWNLNETLTSADLNAEFDNILSGTNNGSLDSDNIDQTDTYTWSGNHTFNSLVTHGANLTVGVDDTGHDVQFFGATSGAHFLWDESADTLKMVGGAKINAQGTVTVGVDDTGYDVKFFGATTGKSWLWDESADTEIVTGNSTISGTLGVTAGDARLGSTGTWTADQTFNDNVNITLGTGGDADLYFDGTNTYLDPQVVGTGGLAIGSSAPNQSTAFWGAGFTDVLISSANGIGGQLSLASSHDANGTITGLINFIQLNNADSGNGTQARGVAQIFASSVTSDANAGDDMGADLVFYTKAESAGSTEAMRITSTNAVSIVGALSKGSGSFRIRHPLPERDGYDLVHSFVEGPQADLIYRGVVTLVGGQAIVNIDTAGRMTDGTFEALCTNVQSFTSNESNDDCVRGSVSGNVLTITSSNAASTASISWMVIGERKDQHMIDTEWTDENGRVITEPLTEVREVIV